MAQKIILYVGLHKTASSSIQRTCAASQPRLLAAGFAYPTFSSDGEEHFNHTRLLRNMFRRNPERMGLAGQFTAGSKFWAQPQRDSERARFASFLASTGARVILAAEGLSIFSPDELAALRDWLSAAGFQPRVICHVRHIVPWLNSMVAQRVRGQAGLTIAEAVQELVDAGGLIRPRVEAIRSVFPQAGFFSHETAVQHKHGPPGFFLETIGLRDSDGIRWIRANEGTSDLGVRVLSVVCERFGRAKWQGSPEEMLAFMLQPGLVGIRKLGGPKFALLESEAAPLATFIDSENAWLRDQLGPAFHQADAVFPQARPATSAGDQAALEAAIQLCEPDLREHLRAKP